MPVVWETARAMLTAKRRHDWLDLTRSALRGVLRLLTTHRPLATPEFVDRFTRPERLRVTYLLPRLVIAGGVLSVIQLVNHLILLGVEAGLPLYSKIRRFMTGRRSTPDRSSFATNVN